MSELSISKRVFWDVKVEEIDFEKDRFFVIERVLNYGVWNDFRALLRRYDDETIRQEIVKTTYLKKEVLNFVCFYFNLKPSQFKCYKRRQLQEKHWNY